MSDKYHRLVTFVVDICPRPLRELLITKAKADSSTGVPFTTLDAYLQARKSKVDILLNKSRIRIDQYALIYPPSGSVDVNTWDVTLLAILLTEFFRKQLSTSEKSCINFIRDTRNTLQHIASCHNLNDKDYNKHWGILEHSVKSLATTAGSGLLRNISSDIIEAMNGNMPNLGDVLRTWYLELTVDLRQQVRGLQENDDQLQSKMNQLQEENDHLREKVDEIQEQNVQLQTKVDNLQITIDRQNNDIKAGKVESQKSNTILNKASVKRKGRSGIAQKKMKVIDRKVEKMKENLARSMKKLQKETYTSHSEDVEQIKQHLEDNHRVIVTGYDNNVNYKCAVAAVVSMEYQADQCLEINNPADWKRVFSDEVRLVVFNEPFGRQTYDAQKANVMMDEFDNMLEQTSDEEDVVIDIIIVANQNTLDKTRRSHKHKMLTPSCTVFIDTENEVKGFEMMSGLLEDGPSYAYSTLHPSVTDISNPVPGVFDQHVWSVVSKQNYNISMAEEVSCLITSCCQLPSGEFLLADINNKRLKKLDAGYRVIGVCDVPDTPWDVCYIGNNEAVVAFDFTLQFVDVTGMTLTRSVSTEHDCSRLTCHGDQLYVAGNNKVYMYSTRGIKQRVLYTHTDNSMYSIVMSDDGSKMYIPCWSGLITIDSSGNLLSTFSDLELDDTPGVCVDGEGHVLVSDLHGRIVQISSDGKHYLGPITNISGDKVLPRAICFDRHKSVLTCAGRSENVVVLQLK